MHLPYACGFREELFTSSTREVYDAILYDFADRLFSPISLLGGLATARCPIGWLKSAERSVENVDY